MKSNLIDVEVHLHHETEKAYLISRDGDRGSAVWVPKSAVEMEKMERTGSIWVLTGPEPILIDKGLV